MQEQLRSVLERVLTCILSFFLSVALIAKEREEEPLVVSQARVQLFTVYRERERERQRLSVRVSVCPCFLKDTLFNIHSMYVQCDVTVI